MANSRYRVASPHHQSYEVPLVLQPGDRVEVIKNDTTWPEWV
jgi:hypothetical protein